MSITVQCQQCGKQFLAPEQMAGKRVRCKQCGSVFDIPSAVVGDEEEGGLDALADLAAADDTSVAASAGSGAIPTTGKSAAAAVESSGDPWAEMNLADVESTSVRANHPFRYPYSRAVDQYVPFLLVFGGLAWMVTELVNSNASGRPWIPLVQILLIAVLFMLVVLPITTHGVKAGARKARFSLPPKSLWRTAATFCFPVVLGVILWLVGGTLGNFIVGCLAGMMVAFGAYWLLFRPTPQEVGPAFGFAGGWFLVSVAAGVAAMFALNLLLFTIMTAARSAHEFSASPLGPALSWNAEPPPPAPDQPKAPVRAPPVVASPPSVPDSLVPAPPPPDSMGTATMVPSTPPAADTVASAPPTHPDTGTAEAMPSRDFNGASVTPTVDSGDPATPKPPASDLVAAGGTATNAEQGDIPIVDGSSPIQPMQTPSASPIVDRIVDLTELAPGQAMITSPAGGARFAVTKPVDAETDQVSLWDAAAAKRLGAVKFRRGADMRDQYVINPSGNGLARIATWPRRHIQVWSFADKRVLDPMDLVADGAVPSLIGFLDDDVVVVLWDKGGRRMLQSWNVRTRRIVKQVDLPNYEATRGNYAISPNGRHIAVAAKMDAVGGGERRGQIQIIDMTLGRAIRRLSINALESRWPVEPAGVAYSPDGSQLAILMENRGDALLVCWRVSDGVVLHEHIFRAGTLVDPATPPFAGNALAWIDHGNAWLAYGRKVIDARQGDVIGHIDLPNVTDQYVIDENSVALLTIGGESDPKAKVSVVDLKLDELATIRRGEKPASAGTGAPSNAEGIEVVP